jgi:adenylate kinase
VVAGKIGVPHISTGDIFRANVSGGTPLGVEAKEYMDAGQLVPDSVTNAMVRDRLAEPDAENGFLLDGYPRNPDQAEVLDTVLREQGHQLDAVVELVVDLDEVARRLLGRAQEQGRADDTEHVIRQRLQVYRDETAPVIAYYRERDLLRSVDGVGDVDVVTQRLLAALPG